MMDYPTWRKKAPTPQFITFSNAYRLDQLVNNDERTATATNTTATATATSTSTPQTVANVTSGGVSIAQQQQQAAVADNIATIIGVTAGHSHTNVINQQTVRRR